MRGFYKCAAVGLILFSSRAGRETNYVPPQNQQEFNLQLHRPGDLYLNLDGIIVGQPTFGADMVFEGGRVTYFRQLIRDENGNIIYSREEGERPGSDDVRANDMSPETRQRIQEKLDKISSRR
jgi:hypothetical protein